MSRLEKLENGIKKSFYIEGKGYKSKDFEDFDGRANAILVLSGIVNESQYENIKNILVNQDGNTPFWEKYILEALCNMDMYEEAENRIKTKYGEMVELRDEYSSTLWEYFEKDKGSKNHTWSAGPMIIMQKYIAGISPIDAGFEKIRIKPNLITLNKIESKVETVKGKVELKAIKTENEINIEVSVPSKTLLYIPKVKTINMKVTENGKNMEKNIDELIDKEEEYTIYCIEEGKHSIRVY